MSKLFYHVQDNVNSIGFLKCFLAINVHSMHDMFVKVAAVLLLTVTCATASEGENLLVNSGFTSLDGNGKPIGWVISPVKSDIASVVIDTTNSTVGGQSVRIQHNDSFYTRIEQLHVKVKPRTEYLVEFSCKIQQIEEFSGSRGASLFIGNNGVLMSQHARVQAESHPKVPGWHTYSQVINTRNNHELGICLYLHNSSGTVWFDNVKLLELTPTLNESLANERARKLIRPDIDKVRVFAEATNNTKILSELKSLDEKISTQAFQTVKDYRVGLPYYDIQRRLYRMYGEMLAGKYPQKQLIVSKPSPFFRSSHLQSDPIESDKAIDIVGVRNDVEQFVLNFTNCSTEDIVVRSVIPDEIDMTVRRVVEVQSSIGIIDDPLRKVYPTTSGEYSFDIPAGMTKQIWFELKLDSQPLEQNFTLKFHTDSEVFTQLVNLTVLNQVFPETMPLKTFSYAWAYTRNLTTSRISEASEDLRTHHNNVWMNRRGQALPGPVVENGKLIPQKMQWHFIDKNLTNFPFRKTFIFFAHLDYLKYGPEVFGDWVREIVRGFKERGLGYDELLITWLDEPFASGVREIVKVSQLVRETDPKLRIYSNFHDVLSPADIRLLAETVDVIAPEYNQLNTQNIKIIEEAGAELWCYRVQERQVDPHDVRIAFWNIHKANVQGYSEWCYVENKNGWNMPEGASCYNMVYDGDSREITPSKRWEAWREGIEDYALLDQLKLKSPQVYDEVINTYDEGNLELLRVQILSELSR